MNAAAAFLEILSENPHRTAVVEPKGRSIKYDRLLRRMLGFAQSLLDDGMAPGDRVILQVPNGIDFATTALGVLLAGGVPVLIEPGLGEQVYLSRAAITNPKWLFVHPLLIRINAVPFLPRLLQKLELDVPPVPPLSVGMKKRVLDPKYLDALESNAPSPESFHPADRADDDDGILIFTGGTTSLPKGVRLSHKALDYYISHITSAISDLHLENFLADTPQQVLYALRLGKTAYITKGRKKKRAQYVFDLVTSGKVDAYFGSPYVWTEMMAQKGTVPGTIPPTLKTVLLGGAPVTPAFLQTLSKWLAPSTRMQVLYGMTEAGPVCAVDAQQKMHYEGQGDLVGSTLGEVRIEIRDQDPQTGVGEVVVHSPSLFSGYLEQEPREKNDGFATDDFGKFVESEMGPQLTLLGRKKDMIIRNGVNIYPVSFEGRIKSIGGDCPWLREAAMIGLWNEKRQDEDVVLCFEPVKGRKLSLDALRKNVEKLCGTDAKPDHYMEVVPIPVTGRQNKVDKKILQQKAAEKFGLQVR